MVTFKDQVEFLISVHEIEEIFIQTLLEFQNIMLQKPVIATIDPWIQADYQGLVNTLVAGLTVNSKSIQALTDYCDLILSQNPRSGYGLALRGALQNKASATQQQTTTAWSAAPSPAQAPTFSKQARDLKDQLLALMAWDDNDDAREIIRNLNDFYKINKHTCLLALRELLTSENERKQFTAFVKKILSITPTDPFACWLAEEIGNATYPPINDIKEIFYQNNTITGTLVALAFYARQTKRNNKGSLLSDAVQLMYQHYDHDFFIESDDIFILLFKNSFTPSKDEMVLSEEKSLILYQLLITDAKHAIALALAIIEHSILDEKNHMHIHKLIELMQKALQETGTEREFGVANPGTTIQIYREQMIRDLLKTFDAADRLHVKQAEQIVNSK